MKNYIYLLGNDEVYNTFQDANQLYGYLNRLTRSPRGKVLIVRNQSKARCYNLTNESPAEIHALVLKFLHELNQP